MVQVLGFWFRFYLVALALAREAGVRVHKERGGF